MPTAVLYDVSEHFFAGKSVKNICVSWFFYLWQRNLAVVRGFVFQLCKSSSSTCGMNCCSAPPCTLPQCSAASLNYCNSLCTLRPSQHNGRHPVIDIRPTTIKYSGILAAATFIL